MARSENSILATLNSIALKENLRDHAVEIKELTTEGANYSSAIYKAKITSTDHETLNLFIKIANMSESVRSEIKNSADFIYTLEIYFYTDMVPKYEFLQIKYGIPAEDRFRFSKYYGSNASVMEETLVLEDLVEQGYTLYDRFKPLDWAYASKAAEELAKFHALSFVYQREYRELYLKDYSKFNNYGTNAYAMQKFFKSMSSTILQGVPGKLEKRVQAFVDEHLTDDTFKKYYQPGKWNVLVHGDYRASNIMHKENDGCISSLIPVDYQTLHLGSPSTDLMYLIYTGTDEGFRRDHLHQLKDLYYETLAKWLRQMNLDPDRVFSRKDFEEDYRDMLAYGLRTALFILPIVLVESEEAPTLSGEDSALAKFTVKPSESFKNRLSPILDEFISLGVL